VKITQTILSQIIGPFNVFREGEYAMINQHGTPQSLETHDDKIYRETKWLAAFIIPFLIAAFYILYLRPTETGELFAWKINPTMTARMLGAAYMGGIYFFTRTIWATRWHSIALGFLPVTAFASAMCIATILHWDRFNHGHISFITWVALYFTTPFLVMATWLRNRRTDPGTPEAQDILFPLLARLAVGALGAITLLISVLLFLQPVLMVNNWPWTLTPLTARVVGGMFSLPGVLGLYMAVDGRWSSARIMLESQTFSIAFIVLASVLSWNEFDQTKISTWLFAGGMPFLLIALSILYLSMEWRRKTTLTVARA
jgi:hypothetical protein